jgi:hypothetical protein
MILSFFVQTPKLEGLQSQQKRVRRIGGLSYSQLYSNQMGQIAVNVLLLFLFGLWFVASKPLFDEKAEIARWLIHENVWGTLSTISVHLEGYPWGQAISFVDGNVDNSTGNVYFYTSDMDTSMQVAKIYELLSSIYFNKDH